MFNELFKFEKGEKALLATGATIVATAVISMVAWVVGNNAKDMLLADKPAKEEEPTV